MYLWSPRNDYTSIHNNILLIRILILNFFFKMKVECIKVSFGCSFFIWMFSFNVRRCSLTTHRKNEREIKFIFPKVIKNEFTVFLLSFFGAKNCWSRIVLMLNRNSRWRTPNSRWWKPNPRWRMLKANKRVFFLVHFKTKIDR